jgi:hypothetical protein
VNETISDSTAGLFAFLKALRILPSAARRTGDTTASGSKATVASTVFLATIFYRTGRREGVPRSAAPRMGLNDYHKLNSFFNALAESFETEFKFQNIYRAADRVRDLYLATNFPTDEDPWNEFVEAYDLQPLLWDDELFERYFYDKTKGRAADQKLSKFIDKHYPTIKRKKRKAQEYELKRLQDHRRLNGGPPSTRKKNLMRSLGLEPPNRRQFGLMSVSFY